MSGIMAAVAGTGQNVIYANGLFNTTYGVELSPIDIGTVSSIGGATSVTYQWIGYYKPSTSASVQLGAICNYNEYYSAGGITFPYPWIGGGNSTCYIWTGNTAKSGWAVGNQTAFIQNGTGGGNFGATANSYVPIRIQWSCVLPQQYQYYAPTTYNFFAEANFTFTIASTSSISGRIFYNTLTNGF
jgi:hypothetical protein